MTRNSVLDYSRLISLANIFSFGKCAIFALMMVVSIFLNACGGHHYAPVRSYYRDIPATQKYYVVRRGDTLYGIGYRSGHGYKRLAEWNHLGTPYRLYIGQKLRLFNPGKWARASAGTVGKHKSRKKTRAKSQINDKSAIKTRNKSQKNPSFSYANKKLLKLHWQWPIRGKILKNFPQTGNKGIDISGKFGQAVRAAAAGKVVYSGHGLVGYGNLLIIKHNSLYLSAYANNRRLRVKEGQNVRKGQIIAEVGRARGMQTSLHFEIRKNGKPVNPVKYLP